MTLFKTSLRNTRWATQYLSDVWLSTNGVLHVHWESYNLQAGANTNSPLTGAKRPQSGAKRPGGETSWGRNVLWKGETSRGRNVHKPWYAHKTLIDRTDLSTMIWTDNLQTAKLGYTAHWVSVTHSVGGISHWVSRWVICRGDPWTSSRCCSQLWCMTESSSLVSSDGRF